MNIMIWNIRGFRASKPRLHQLIHEHRLNILVIIEPKHTSDTISRYALEFGFSNSYASTSESIWFFWRNSHFELVTVQDEEQVVHFTLTYRPLQYTFVLSAVYGNHTPSLRQSLWSSLCTFSANSTLPWVFGGDFNTFRSLSDHEGRSRPSLSVLQDFNDCIEACALMSPPFHGSRFTRSDGRGLGRVRRRLDWLFLNTGFHDKFEDIQLTHLPRITSDHTPLLLKCRNITATSHRSFRFLDSWLLHPDFYTYMRDAWASYPTTGGMHGFYTKLFKFKKDVQQWNKDIFGNIFSRVQQAEVLLTRVEERWDTQPTEANRMEYNRAKADFLQASSYEMHF